MESAFLFKISFASLGDHKLRTFLTMLGVIIGVAAVVAMLSIGEGAKQEAMEQIEILGINNVIINAKAPEIQGGIETGVQKSLGLSLADGENIRQFTDLVENVVPQRYEPISSISCYRNESPVRVVATEPNFVFSSSIEVEQGRFINKIDIEDFRQVCVLGAKVKKELFAFDNPLGKIVRIGDLDFTVVGTMADKYIGRGKVEGFELKNLNEDVYIPFTTAAKKFERTIAISSFASFGRHIVISEQSGQAFNTPEIDQLTVTVADLKYVSSVAQLIENIMRRRHAGVVDYEIVVPESLLRQSQKNSANI